MNKVFIPKDHPDLPDHYGVEVQLVTGKTDKFDLASHKIIYEGQLLSLATRDDEWVLIPFQNIAKATFDKRWSKVVALVQEEERKKQEAKNAANAA